MLNLLPKDYKDKVRNEYLLRFYIVSLIIFSLIVIFFLVALFPAYILINTQKNIAEETSRGIKNSPTANDRNVVLANIKDLETRLKAVAVVSGEKPSDYMDKALELKSGGIYVNSISYIKTADLKKQIVLEGQALSRADLLNFSKKIKSSSWTITSDIPLANLASDKNIPFSVTLTATSTLK